MRDTILRALARLACRHYGWVLLVASLLTIAALTPILRSGYSSSFNVARMLPQEIPASRAFIRSLTDFGTADEAVIVFHLNQDDSEKAIKVSGALAERIAKRLQEHPDIHAAFVRKLTEAEKDQLLNTELPRRGMLFLKDEDIKRAEDALTTDAINANVEKGARLLSSAISADETQDQVIMNILGLGSIFRDSFMGTLENKNTKEGDYSGNYIVSPNRAMMLLVIEPTIPAQSIHFSRRIMDEIEEVAYEEMEGARALSPSDLSTQEWVDLLDAWRATDGTPILGRSLFASLTEEDREKFDHWLEDIRTTRSADSLQRILRLANKELRTAQAAKRLSQTTHPHAGTLQNLIEKEEDSYKADARSNGLKPEALHAARMLRLNRQLIRLDQSELPASAGRPLSESEREAFRMEFGGGYAIARAYGSKLNGILLSTLLLSAALVLIFFGYSFRRYGVLIFIGIPLFMIVCWTIGMGWLLFEQLNLISCAFAAVLIGLGVDYGVHIYNRYIEERAKGENVEESFAVSLSHTGWGVLIGMVTTCLAFVALHATRFSQLAEFGVLSGIGVALSVPAMMIVMPALVAWRAAKGGESVSTMRPATFFLPGIATLVERNPRLVATIGLLIAGACLLVEVAVPDAVVFDPRMSNLRPKDRAFAINGEIAAAFAKRNPNKLTFMVTAPTEPETMAMMAEYEQKLKALQDAGLILGYESVTRYLPSPSEQARRMEAIRKIDFGRALADFKKALDAQGMNEEPFRFNTQLLSQHKALAESGALILPSEFKNSKIARLVAGYVSRRRRDYYIDDGVFPQMESVTLARAAQTRDGEDLRYPAGTTLSAAEVWAINTPGMPYGKRVNPITIYEGGWAIKATVFPLIPKGSDTGEPVITDEWLEEVRAVLDLPPALFAPEADETEYPVNLTGVAVVGKVLSRVVKHDFLKISVWIFGISLCVVNLFYHKKPLRAILSATALVLGALYLPPLRTVWDQADFPRLICWIVIALFFIWGTLCHRRLVRVVYCFLPVCLGLIYLLGGVAFYNLFMDAIGLTSWRMDLNFVNVLTIPIIIGVGIDNGIHLVNRYFEDGRQVRPVVIDTGRALTITALTSMFGFGSLYLAKFQGLGSMASLGILSVLALAMVLLASVLVFPAILATFSPLREKAEDEVEEQIA